MRATRPFHGLAHASRAPPAAAAAVEEDSGSEEWEEETEAWKWAELSPYALRSALPGDESRPSEELVERLRWIRLLWWVVLLVVYSSLLLLSSTDRTLSSALRQEIIDELMPDWNKASERMKEGDRTPELKELLHADDVAQTLTLYNDLCREQASTHASIKDVWECKLFDVVVGRLSGAEWDPAMNRHLPDHAGDDVFESSAKGVFDHKISEFAKDQADSRRAELQAICSPSFWQSHVVIGDDPKKVPWGDVTAFSKEIAQASRAESGLDPVFDSFPIRGRGQTAVTDRLDALQGDEMATQHSVKRLEQELLDGFVPHNSELQQTESRGTPFERKEPKRSSFARLHRRNPWLLDVEELTPPPSASSLAQKDSAAKAEASQSQAQPFFGPLSRDAMERKLVDEDDQFYGTGCFDTHDVAGLLRDVWVTHLGNRTSDMTEGEAKKMLEDVFPTVLESGDGAEQIEKLWKSIKRARNDTLSGTEFLAFAEQHLKEFQFPARGYLNLECRNHHFGLISLCKPSEISLLYQVAFVPSRSGRGIVKGGTGTRLHIRFIFTEVEANSGWYRGELRVFIKSKVGNADTLTTVAMILTLLLVLFLTLWDTMMTLVLMPINLLRVVWLDLPSRAPYEEIEHKLWMKILYVVDGRGLVSQILATLTILTERMIGLCFVGACLQAAREARMPNSMPTGAMSEQCTYAWLRANKDWIINSVSGEYVEHGLSIISYINECTELQGPGKVGEIMFQLLFEEEGSYHAMVVGLVFVRVLECFNLSDRLRWLPRTIFLAKFKLTNFVIAYVALVTGFALLMTLYFGELYQQYSSLDRSFYTLLVYSFGMTERATYGMHPFVERSGNHLYAVLFVFSVFMVTIILNMFTTIVIDAFAAEGEPEKFNIMYQEEVRGVTQSLLTFFGKGHIVAKQMRKTQRASASAFQARTSLASQGEASEPVSEPAKGSEPVSEPAKAVEPAPAAEPASAAEPAPAQPEPSDPQT